MAAEHYKIGQPVRLKVKIGAGVQTSGGVQVKVRKPDKTLYGPQAAVWNPDTLQYEHVFTGTDQEGTYHYALIGTGDNAGRTESAFVIDHSEVD